MTLREVILVAAKKAFEAQPDDTYTKWSWNCGDSYLILNTRYYLTLSKAKQNYIEQAMKRVRATMEVFTK